MSLLVTTIDHNGKKAAKTTLPKEVFSMPASPQLLSQAIRVYTDHQHQNTNVAQSRSDVKLTTAKVWRQKGTGRARHGSRKAPIFVGGGQAHGPVAQKHQPLKLLSKMKKKALLGILTQKQAGKQITAIIDPQKITPKTQAVKSWLEKAAPESKNIVIILDKPHTNFIKAIKNIANASATQAARLNILEIARADHILITKESLDILKSTYKHHE